MNKRVFLSIILFVEIFFLGSCQDGTVNNDSTTIIGSKDVVSHIQASKGSYTDRVEISWKGVNENSQYVVYRSLSEDSGFEMIGSASDTSFSDTIAQVDRIYFYRVRTSSTDGLSDFSPYDTGYILINTSDYGYSEEWGTYGTKDGEFDVPGDIAIKNGYIYVSDRENNRVQVFLEEDHSFVFEFGSQGADVGEFECPSGIAVNEEGYIYVADRKNHRIQQFDASGSYFNFWGGNGDGEGQFQEPVDIAIDKDGHVYVVDMFNHRVQKFSGNGTFVSKWGGTGQVAGQFESPWGIAIDNEGFVYVASRHKLQKFTDEGIFIDSWGYQNTGLLVLGGFFKEIRDIEIDSKGYIYIADRVPNAIHKFTSEGTLVNVWSFDAFAVDFFSISNSDELFLSDVTNNKIQVWSKQ